MLFDNILFSYQFRILYILYFYEYPSFEGQKNKWKIRQNEI
jgi:hypothetical protein